MVEGAGTEIGVSVRYSVRLFNLTGYICTVSEAFVPDVTFLLPVYQYNRLSRLTGSNLICPVSTPSIIFNPGRIPGERVPASPL